MSLFKCLNKFIRFRFLEETDRVVSGKCFHYIICTPTVKVQILCVATIICELLMKRQLVII